MSKSLMVYHSLGGTTARVAESIRAGLRTAGYLSVLSVVGLTRRSRSSRR
jgi:flavodoxin